MSWHEVFQDLITLAFTKKWKPKEKDCEYECNHENEEFEFDYDDNPYEDHSWAGMEWFCIRCGYKLEEISKNDPTWGSNWKTMKKQGTVDFLCSNKECCHNSGPLTLHHPNSCTAPAGESYSLSWIR